LKLSDAKAKEQCALILYKMCKSGVWEVRHGGMLGLKSFVFASKEECLDALSQVFELCYETLNDDDEDVKALAADILIEIIPKMSEISAESLNELTSFTLMSLVDADGLSHSISRTLLLLGKIRR
jgi:TATA-binding protein-associated factor